MAARSMGPPPACALVSRVLVGRRTLRDLAQCATILPTKTATRYTRLLPATSGTPRQDTNRPRISGAPPDRITKPHRTAMDARALIGRHRTLLRGKDGTSDPGRMSEGASDNRPN